MTSKYEFWLRQGNLNFHFPVNPETVKVDNKAKNTTVDVEGLGEVTIFKSPNPMTFQFNVEFPKHYYYGCQYEDIQDPTTSIAMLETMKRTGPARFIVTNTPLNTDVSIEDLSFEEKGGDVGTLHVDITLKVYKKPEVIQMKVQSKVSSGTIVIQPIKAQRPPSTTKTKEKTYTVIQGDYLIKIAKKTSVKDWRDIAKLNNIKTPYMIHPGNILKLP